MTRKEEIKEAAITYLCGDKSYSAEWETRGFIAGAEWSDEHPIHYDGQAMLHVLHKGVEQGKEEMLDRVCKWLEEHSWDYLVGADNVYILLDDKMVSDLKKAMEG